MRNKRSELTRTKIVETARTLFLEKGFDATSVAEICRLSGVSNGALFHQFPVKEDVAFAVYSKVRLEYWNRVVGTMVAATDPLDGIEAAVLAAFAFMQDEPGAAAFMSDVTGSKWIESYAHSAQPVYDEVTARGADWAIPHLQAGRLAPVTADVFIALVSGAPQWIGRMVRIGFASSTLDAIGAEMAKFVRRAFEPR